MKTYVSKHYMIYYICDCNKNIIIPTNDHFAYEHYKKFRFLYDKYFIAKSQGVLCGKYPKLPLKFPVIVRPKINLMGMGKNAYFANNSGEIKRYNKEDFWVEKFKGEHFSVDVFFNQHGILGIIAFKGISGPGFTFKLWEYIKNYSLSERIIKWIYTYLKGFSGVFNLEIIGNKIIECHLRMGDLNFFQNKNLINKVIECHLNQFVIIGELKKIYLIPIFVKKGKYIKLKGEDILKCAREVNSGILLHYLIDKNPKNFPNPDGGDRICILTVTNKQLGFKIKKKIINSIDM